MRSYFLSSGQEPCNQNPPSQAGKFSSGCIAFSPDPLHCCSCGSTRGSPIPGGRQSRALAPCAQRGVRLLLVFYKPCTIFRRRWTVLARGQRQPSPCQEARCMVTLPGSPWQGWESFSRCDQTACGSRRSRAACLRGTPALCHRARPASPPPKHSPSVLGAAPPWSILQDAGPGFMDGFGARSSSRMERLFPLPSSPAGAFHLLSNVVARAEPHSQQTAVTDGRS